MNRKEKRALLSSKNTGLVIDGIHKIPWDLSTKGLVVVAPTGAGKTTNFLIPQLLRLDGQSVICTDPSGEIQELCEGYLRSIGYGVETLNLMDSDKSSFYNPLSKVHTESELNILASVITESAFPNPSSSDSFWNSSAESLLGVFLKAVHSMPDEQKNLGYVFELLNRFGFEPDAVNEIINPFLTESNRQKFKGFLALEDKMKNSVLATSQTILKAMSDPNIVAITSQNTIDFEKLRTSKLVLFIRVREDLIPRFQFLLGVFFSQLFDHLMREQQIGQAYNPILLLLEEAGNIYVPSLAQVVNTIRKRNVSVSLLLQDYQQLEALYGVNNASAILNGGMTSKIILPGVSIQSCELIERMMGIATVQRQESGFGTMDETQKNRYIDQGRPLMTAEEIRTMQGHLFLSASSKPLLLKTNPFYKIPELMKRSQM